MRLQRFDSADALLAYRHTCACGQPVRPTPQLGRPYFEDLTLTLLEWPATCAACGAQRVIEAVVPATASVVSGAMPAAAAPTPAPAGTLAGPIMTESAIAAIAPSAPPRGQAEAADIKPDESWSKGVIIIETDEGDAIPMDFTTVMDRKGFIAPSVARRIYTDLMLMAIVDGDIAPEEDQKLEAYRKRLKLPVEDAQEIRTLVTSGQATKIKVGRSAAERKLAFLAACNLAAADGWIDDTEMLVLQALQKHMDIDQQTFDRAMEMARARTGSA